MLKAISGGKMRQWEMPDGEKLSARKAYRDWEDHVTAAVFARLSYLPYDMVWRILDHAKTLTSSPQYKASACPRIKSIRFWPSYPPPDGELDDARNRVEPDVVIETHAFTLIVEAKRWDDVTLHTATQIKREVAAYRLRLEETDRDLPIRVLLVGGQPPEIEESLRVAQIELRYISWYELRRYVIAERETIRKDSERNHYRRVLRDIEEALELHGVIPWVNIADVPSTLVEELVKSGSQVQYLAKQWRRPMMADVPVALVTELGCASAETHYLALNWRKN